MAEHKACPLCGFVSPPGDTFCGLCGASLKAAGPALPPAKGAPSPPAGAESPREEAPPGEAPAAAAAAAPRPRFVLPSGKSIAFPGEPRAIGRKLLGGFAPEGRSAQLSRQHVTIYEKDGRAFAEDGATSVQAHASPNGTWVQRAAGGAEEKITGQGAVELKPGDSLVLARVVTLRMEW